MKKRAFTLAEILISMAIIGVISVLMVPVLQNTQKKALETATVHFHSMMSQAIKTYMVDQDVKSLSDSDMSAKDESRNNVVAAYKGIDEFMYKYLSVAKVCSYNDRYDCFNKEIKSMSDQKGEFVIYRRFSVPKKTNTNIYVLDNGNTISISPCSDGESAAIQVDINGKKGPNRVGRDIWTMNIYHDGVISDSLHSLMLMDYYKNNPSQLKNNRNNMMRDRFNQCQSEQYVWQYGAGCFARFENNGFKFDY